MRFRILTVLAAAALVAACSSTPKDSGRTAGTGTGASSTTMDNTGVATTDTGTGVTPGTLQDFNVNVGNTVYFGYDRYDLTSDAQAQLQRQATWLQSYPQIAVTIEGHADERGTREYNLALGEQRANSVKNYLVALGVDPSRVQTISYGKERPVALGTDEASYALNRRGVTTLQ